MPLTDRTTYTLNVCTDCLQYLANGEVTDGDGNDITTEHAARVVEQWGRAHLVPGRFRRDGETEQEQYESESEPHFSWYECEGCGSTLGGDRYPATAFVQDLTSP